MRGRPASAATLGLVSTPATESASFYDAVGGAPTFLALVTRFYEGVARDPVLRPMYPDADLGAAADRLRMFLEQYWGGPTTYQDQRGHPRLRMRHAPFAVTPTAREHWLTHMGHAVTSLGLPADLRRQLWGYLSSAADSLVNTDEPEPTSGGPMSPERPTSLPAPTIPVVRR